MAKKVKTLTKKKTILGKLFGGRIGRGYFFGASFSIAFIYAVIQLSSKAVPNYLYYLCLLVILVIALSIDIRRWHDIGKSGWWCLLILLPGGNILVYIYLLFAPGQKGKNKYGEQPSSFYL